MPGLFPSEINSLLSILGVIAIGSMFAIIGNGVIDRIPKHQSIIRPGPYCTSCAAKLMWYDIIPVLSYFIRLKGKCPYCGANMPIRNVVVDLAIIGWVAILVIRFGWSYEAILNIAFGVGLIILFVIQKENRQLSTFILLLLAMLSMIYLLAFEQEEFPMATVSFFVGGTILFLYNTLKIVTKVDNNIDFGEVEFGAILGLFLGFYQIVVCIFLAVLSGAIFGSFRIQIMKKDYKSAVPDFPMFMSASAIFTLLFGPEVFDLFKNILSVF